MSRPAPSRGNVSSRPSTSYRGNVHGNIGAAPRANAITRGYAGGRGNVYRGGVYRGGAYRGGYRPGLYGRGRYYGNRFYGHGAFYNRYYLPRLGFRINVLPYGYYPFYWGDYQYYYSDGYYYQQTNDDYTVVEPPVGAILNQLPAGATSIMIDGQQYYELNGVYYQAVTQDNGSTGYQIAGKDGELTTGAGAADQSDQVAAVAPNIGDVVNSLPADCNTVKINGQKYYVSPDGFYYQEDHDSNNNLVYRVAGTPTDEPSN